MVLQWLDVFYLICLHRCFFFVYGLCDMRYWVSFLPSLYLSWSPVIARAGALGVLILVLVLIISLGDSSLLALMTDSLFSSL